MATIPVMGVVAVIVFLLLHLAPGSPAALIAGDFATAEDIARIGKQLGLDRPLHVQFVAWVGQILRGDLGTSIFSHLPVSRLIRQRIEPTVVLSVTTLLIAVVLAVPIGVLAAWRARTWVDRLVMGLSVCGLSIPSFVLGYLLIYVFAIHFGWLPVQGYVSFTQGLWPCVRSILLPSFALGSIYMALIARITRASVLEVLEEDYVRTAHAKGLSTLTVLVGHALRNASIPIVTIIGVGADAPDRRGRHHGERLRDPGNRTAHGGRHPPARLPDHPGGDPALLRGVRDGEPRHRSRVHGPRSEDPLLMRTPARTRQARDTR